MLTDKTASQLIHAFITSCIDYCNSILYGMPDTILSDLQRIQNTAARIKNYIGYQLDSESPIKFLFRLSRYTTKLLHSIYVI